MKRRSVASWIFAGIGLLACVGIGGETPKLKFVQIIGDMRGKGMANLAVTVAGDGTAYLLMSNGRIAVFDKNGKYLKSLKATLPWPQDYCYVTAMGKNVLVGEYDKDYPWVFSPQRAGSEPGRFQKPSMVAADEGGRLFVCDTGNNRVQIFPAPDAEQPKQVIKLGDPPVSLGVRGNLLAVLDKKGGLTLYEEAGGEFKQKNAVTVGQGGKAVAITPDKVILVAFCEGPNHFQFEKYGMTNGSSEKGVVIAPSYMNDWPNLFVNRSPMTKSPDGEICFGAQYSYKILSLDPKTDSVQELPVKCPAPPMGLGFSADGRMYVGQQAGSGDDGPRLMVFSNKEGDGDNFLDSGAPLYKDAVVPIWGVLPAADGSVYVRIIEEGHNKGWPAMTFMKLSPDGKTKPFLDLGSLYNKRVTYHPSFAPYSMEYDKSGNIIMAVFALPGVLKAGPDGKIQWMATWDSEGGADKIEFKGPMDTAQDSKGNTWVADYILNRIFCLSPAGKKLLEYGTDAGVDDIQGKGFDQPSGIETAIVGGKEYLYVGDSGNQRVVKYEITW